ncbi:chaperone protein PapD [Pantoea sp. PA1]|jgi:P pilus assembly chaperone PapD|uniref:Fimbria/pilus periplasmic chaperone n=1 Tax=Pantoea ananas TaxID=553 RepID=A0A8A4K4V7_PANAN|nr:fimbria/pilus periplasmic chaperone [Pantoea ananatis]MBN6028877.1 fimbria/pilus periplasmic chaperone [Pantoea ananatis]MDH0053377.1 fimbria/pilus periplasmic chaperone [Pantoea ananatis]MDJ0032071.1 fimbria/pilus periplasmic chaperone [Pantoea ananatis]MDJ0043314.1 fimbria/pilus periplasmic chaperone [Pantoea ananatis]PQK81327.1 molecular chaperone [Pantoea ananatis]
MNNTLLLTIILSFISGCFPTAHAALTVDRSRLIFNEDDKSISVNVTNRSTKDPYLAQGWIEDSNEKKITNIMMVLPPVQRVEAGAKTQVRIQGLPDIKTLPKDRESVFYFNLREIPPKSEKANTLMLAMQTRLKVFYRPVSIKVAPALDAVPGVKDLTLTRKNNKYIVNNPTPYYFSFVEGRTSETSSGVKDFEPVMVEPKSKLSLPVLASVLGNSPVLMFVNDYGSQRLISFSCQENICKAEDVIVPKSK